MNRTQVSCGKSNLKTKGRIWALNHKIISKRKKHPKRNHYMVTKWSKKDAHKKLGGAGKIT